MARFRSLTSASIAVLVAATLRPGLARAEVSTDQLQREIEQRDAVIARLAKRLEVLEHEVRASGPARANPPTARAKPAAPPTVAVVTQAVPVDVTPPAPAGPPADRVRVAVRSDEPSDQEIARALENTLINQGGLLLAPWVMQLVPDAGVVYSSQDQLAFVDAGVIPGTTSAGIFREQSHRWDVEFGLGFRIGLPYGLQASIRVPYDWAQGSATLGGSTNRTYTRTGIGDVSLGVQKQVLTEDAGRPAIILNANYKFATGTSSLSVPQVATYPFAVGTGSGFPTVSGGITLQKRQDPLVFLGNVEYYHNFSATIGGVNQRLGDAVEVRLSPILAASPDTSLRVAWDTFFQQAGTISGRQVPGSSQTISFLEFGVGSVLSSRWFMDASVGIGVTKDSPSFRALVQFPFRF